MFDLGWTEMLIIGVVALIVVGPKDLPKMFHTLGQAVGKLRGLASEFQSAMSAAAKEAGVDELQKDMRNLTSGKTFKDAAGLEGLEKDLDIPGKPLHRPITPGPGTKKLESTKPAATPSSSPVELDDSFDGFDEDSDAIAAEYDADVAARELAARELAARNEKLTQVEQLRLEKQARSDQARQEAARLRALREADDATAAGDPAPHPNTSPDASRSDRS